jgi:hypothetical protein
MLHYHVPARARRIPGAHYEKALDCGVLCKDVLT